VCIGQSGYVSDSIVINTGTPQGCVLSPTLYTLYTNECRSKSEKNKLTKFADDSALVGLIENDDSSEYLAEVENLTNWCSTNNLELNVGKTKEMLYDCRKNKVTPPLIEIGGREVDRVVEYKYLGTIISADMTWSSHVDSMVKKCHSRLYFLRKLKQFKMSQTILTLYYRASIESLLTFNFITWFCSSSKENKEKLEKVIKQAEKIVGVELPSLETLYLCRIKGKVRRIIDDPTHPLCHHFQTLPSGKRYRSVRARTNRLNNSFIPSAIRILNGECVR
jgi:Domain of unknown function (DUF1891)/Reverse transcriptase (RNA-dependent DNA polymerase)